MKLKIGRYIYTISRNGTPDNTLWDAGYTVCLYAKIFCFYILRYWKLEADNGQNN